MSNTAEVAPELDFAPLAEAAASIAAGCAVVAAAGVAVTIAAVQVSARAAQAVLTETATERANREANESRDVAAKLATHRARGADELCQALLAQGDPESLLKAAEALGYARIQEKGGASAPVTLVSNDGALLRVERRNEKLVVTADTRKAFDRVMQETQRQRSRAFLEAFSGGAVSEKRLADGRVELHAMEVRKDKRDGRATAQLIVNRDGTVKVDISKIRGNRCEQVLKQASQSLGGTVRAKKIKPDYYASVNVSTSAPNVTVGG